MPTILLLEDKEINIEPLGRTLAHEGYTVVTHNVETGEKTNLRLKTADIVIMNAVSSEEKIINLIKWIRKEKHDLPILILSGSDNEADIVIALDSGADDYLYKPFRLSEIFARIRALLRRAQNYTTVPAVIEVQDITLDLDSHMAWRGKELLSLTNKEFELLAILIKSAGKAIDRETLLRKIWGLNSQTPTKTLDMHISWIRQKIGEDRHCPRYITTIRGLGFRFENSPLHPTNSNSPATTKS